MRKLGITDYRRIAKTMNSTLPGSPHVTWSQVAAIDDGRDHTPSHPVWVKIHAEIQRAKRRRKP